MNQFDTKAHATKWIAVKDLSVVWASAQRQFDRRHADRIAADFDPDMFGTLAVTMPNGNGIYHVIDGQHRRAAIQSLYGDEERVPCNVFDAQDPARAAAIFNKINTSRKAPQQIDTFLVRVTAEYETEVAVDTIIREMGYRVDRRKRDKTIQAVGACVSVYRTFGPDVLRNTLQVIQATWGMDANAVVAPLVRGYGAFLAEYGGKANWQRLTETVSKRFTPGRMLGAARNVREIERCDMPSAVKRLLLKTYDHGLRNGQLGAEKVSA